MQWFFEWSYQQSFGRWCLFSVVGNFAAACGSVLSCWLVSRLFQKSRIFESPQRLTRLDVIYSVGAIVLNSVVAIVGWILWKQGWITIRSTSFAESFVHFCMLIGIMDFAMYAFHRLAHHPVLFRILHRAHHSHVSVNPLSLFVLNPFEVLGFGALLVTALMLVPWSGDAVIGYLVFNLAFGTMGHLGVEPFPKRWMRFALFRGLGTSTFHGLHHAQKAYNFGFYTTLWDRLFGTLHPSYDARFGLPAAPSST